MLSRRKVYTDRINDQLGCLAEELCFLHFVDVRVSPETDLRSAH
jgi:hypothetical protein